MSSPPAPSSSRPGAHGAVPDLARAGELSRRLVAARSSTPRDPGPTPRALDLDPRWSWDELLDACLRQLPAIAAFIVDHRGLLVGAGGALAASVLEGAGARLASAAGLLTELPGLAGAPQVILVEYDGEWLTALQVRTGEGALTLGIISDRPVDGLARGAIHAALADRYTAPAG
jgi:hypothetical protein